jgi:hypothetical protein
MYSCGPPRVFFGPKLFLEVALVQKYRIRSPVELRLLDRLSKLLSNFILYSNRPINFVCNFSQKQGSINSVKNISACTGSTDFVSQKTSFTCVQPANPAPQQSVQICDLYFKYSPRLH